MAMQTGHVYSAEKENGFANGRNLNCGNVYDDSVGVESILHKRAILLLGAKKGSQ